MGSAKKRLYPLSRRKNRRSPHEREGCQSVGGEEGTTARSRLASKEPGASVNKRIASERRGRSYQHRRNRLRCEGSLLSKGVLRGPRAGKKGRAGKAPKAITIGTSLGNVDLSHKGVIRQGGGSRRPGERISLLRQESKQKSAGKKPDSPLWRRRGKDVAITKESHV